MILALLFACAEAPPPRVELPPGGFDLRSEAPLVRVILASAAGAPLTEARYPAPVTTAHLSWPWTPGARYTLRVQDPDGDWQDLAIEAPTSALPFLVQVAAPLGQSPVPIGPGDTISYAPGDEVGLHLYASAPLTLTLTLPGEAAQPLTLSPNAPARLRLRPQGPGTVQIASEAGALSLPLVPVDSAPQVSIATVQFPTTRSGEADLSRPAEAITLPSPLWAQLLAATGLGLRPRDVELPFAYQTVQVQNAGPAPVNVVVRARVEDANGAPHPAFRPRMRSADDGTGLVSVLLRVPAQGEAAATLPLFLDEAALPDSGAWTRVIELRALGAAGPAQTWRGPLTIRRGDSRLTLAFPLALLLSLTGAATLLGPGRRWLRGAPTPELVTVALFAGLLFVAGTAAQLLGATLGAALGPLSTFFTGLIDDAVSYALLSTLLRLLPRRGLIGLTLTLTWLLRGLATGGLSPLDLLFVGARVSLVEAGLWAAGLTRGDGAWRQDSPLSQWLRLSAGFGLSSALSVLTSLILQSVLYRLYFADWYVIALVALPGFAYVLVALALAAPTARALARVEGAC